VLLALHLLVVDPCGTDPQRCNVAVGHDVGDAGNLSRVERSVACYSCRKGNCACRLAVSCARRTMGSEDGERSLWLNLLAAT
jgi:hypothetical protein